MKARRIGYVYHQMVFSHYLSDFILFEFTEFPVRCFNTFRLIVKANGDRYSAVYVTLAAATSYRESPHLKWTKQQRDVINDDHPSKDYECNNCLQ